MGEPSFADLLGMLLKLKDECRTDFRNDGIRNAHRIDFIEGTLIVILEKLRDQLDPK